MFFSHKDVSLPLSPYLPLFLKSISMSSGEDFFLKKDDKVGRIPICKINYFYWYLNAQENIPRKAQMDDSHHF